MYCTERPAPLYPAIARRLRETGLVRVEVHLDTQNKVVKTFVVQSSGYPRLDEAALAAVKQWRCQMPPNTTQPIVLQQQFNFSLSQHSRHY